MTWQQTIDEEKEIAREEGREEGAREKAIANAKNLLNDNIAPEQVSKWIGLPIEQVLALKDELTTKN